MIEKKALVNGVQIYPFTSMDELVDFVQDKKQILMAINAGKIGRVDDEFRLLIRDNIGYADGVGAQVALKKAGFKDASKIPGCDVWLKIVEKKYKTASFYLVGGKQEVINETVAKLKNDFPGINILAHRNGYLKSEEEKEALINDVASKKPDVVFVAMGSPTQENLMKRMIAKHPALYQGLGGSFDVYTGHVKRAPQWLMKLGIEGPYRVITSFNKNRWERCKSDFKIMANILLGKYKIEQITDNK